MTPFGVRGWPGFGGVGRNRLTCEKCGGYTPRQILRCRRSQKKSLNISLIKLMRGGVNS